MSVLLFAGLIGWIDRYIVDVLLPDPGAVPLGLGFPFDVEASHVTAAGVSLQYDRRSG